MIGVWVSKLRVETCPERGYYHPISQEPEWNQGTHARDIPDPDSSSPWKPRVLGNPLPVGSGQSISAFLLSGQPLDQDPQLELCLRCSPGVQEVAA